MADLLKISNASTPGGWQVTCSLLGTASLSRSGGSSASASSGGGGWQVVDRARQKASTEWLDYYPYVMNCTCLIDAQYSGATGPNNSIEGWITTLKSFEVPVDGSQPPLPPILTLSGPVDHMGLFWVCSKLTFPSGETSQIRNAQGERIQQGFTIEFTEYSPSIALNTKSLSPAQQAALGFGNATGQTTLAGSTNYTVVAGDTLQSIAVSQLGNVNLWTQIALLNGLSNSAILQPGQVLLIPVAS